jgi:hypothetical protein
MRLQQHGGASVPFYTIFARTAAPEFLGRGGSADIP